MDKQSVPVIATEALRSPDAKLRRAVASCRERSLAAFCPPICPPCWPPGPCGTSFPDNPKRIEAPQVIEAFTGQERQLASPEADQDMQARTPRSADDQASDRWIAHGAASFRMLKEAALAGDRVLGHGLP
jgi:hypothetical protein